MTDPFAYFRSRELALRANAVALLRDPSHAFSEPLRVALAWRVTPVDWTPPATPCPSTESAVWCWLWDGVDADEVQIAIASSLPVEDVRHWLRQLIANRLIYPDGTIAAIVDEIGNRALAEVTLPKGL